MEVQAKCGEPTLQPLDVSEMQSVGGGYGLYTDFSGMPDRTETCGTMWILDQLLKGMFPNLG